MVHSSGMAYRDRPKNWLDSIFAAAICGLLLAVLVTGVAYLTVVMSSPLRASRAVEIQP